MPFPPPNPVTLLSGQPDISKNSYDDHEAQHDRVRQDERLRTTGSALEHSLRIAHGIRACLYVRSADPPERGSLTASTNSDSGFLT